MSAKENAMGQIVVTESLTLDGVMLRLVSSVTTGTGVIIATYEA